MGVITFNGVSSDKLGILVERIPDYEMPLKKYNRIHVPGRNGDIVMDTGDYDNVDRSYSVAIIRDGVSAPTLSRDLAEWLNQIGYCRLEDSYIPDIYMKAVYNQQVTIANMFDEAGRATIMFNRLPQRFLKSGEKATTYTSDGEITNPTSNVASPKIKIYGDGSGSVTIGAHIINLYDIRDYLVVDSDLEDVYKDYTSMNGNVSIVNGFPKLRKGTVPIKITGGVTKVEITPNWWVI